jgi:outer membrane protein assembly factor BamB
MNTDQTRAADALDQWWDAFQQGQITDGIPTPDMHLIQEITAMHAHAISTADERRIWQQTMAQIRERQERTDGPMDRLLRISIPWPDRRWFPAKLQAAAILILVIVASLIIDLRSGDDRHNPAIFAPGGATPIATPAPQGTPTGGVPMYRGNASRTGETSGPGPASQPSQIWKFSAIVGVGAPSVEMNNIFYLGLDNGSARALDATTGDELWRFDTGKLGRIPFATNGTMVFLTDAESELIALDASTGKEIWRNVGARGGTSPIVYGGNILVDGMNGKSFVLDQKTGGEISHFDFPGELTRSPAYADGVAYGAVKSGTIYAVDVITGSERWHVATGSPEVSTPAIAGGMMFVSLWAADNSGSLAAYEATTGKQIWTYASPNGMGFSATSISNGLVVAGGFDGSVYALNAKDGTLAWSIKTGSNLPITSAPGIAQGIVYVGNADGRILALDEATGSIQWTAQFNGAAAFGPIVDNGMLWLTTTLGEVYAFGAGGSIAGTPVASPSPQVAPSSATLALDWTSYSNQGAEFSSPNNMAVAPNGDLWIVDAGNNRIKILGPDGKYEETWGEFGTGDGQINFFRLQNAPLAAVGGIAIAPDGSFYIADTGNQRIQKFDKDRNFVLSWNQAASQGIGLQEPIGVQVDLDGNVLVLDATIGKVYKYSPDGKFLARFDKVATGIAQRLGQGGCIA